MAEPGVLAGQDEKRSEETGHTATVRVGMLAEDDGRCPYVGTTNAKRRGRKSGGTGGAGTASKDSQKSTTYI